MRKQAGVVFCSNHPHDVHSLLLGDVNKPVDPTVHENRKQTRKPQKQKERSSSNSLSLRIVIKTWQLVLHSEREIDLPFSHLPDLADDGIFISPFERIDYTNSINCYNSYGHNSPLDDDFRFARSSSSRLTPPPPPFTLFTDNCVTRSRGILSS